MGQILPPNQKKNTYFLKKKTISPTFLSLHTVHKLSISFTKKKKLSISLHFSLSLSFVSLLFTHHSISSITLTLKCNLYLGWFRPLSWLVFLSPKSSSVILFTHLSISSRTQNLECILHLGWFRPRSRDLLLKQMVRSLWILWFSRVKRLPAP